MQQQLPYFPRWQHHVLVAAGIYNLLWGAFAILAPSTQFEWAGMEPPRYPELWQCIGMIVGVYGIGYAIAARNPLRHWPIVLVGLLGKIFGPLGFVGAILKGSLPLEFGWTILTNDVIWWIPFTLILFDALRGATAPAPVSRDQIDGAVHKVTTSSGESLADLSAKGPVLTIFTRHCGCIFCREMIADAIDAKTDIENQGVQLAIVHPGSSDLQSLLPVRYKLAGIPTFADSEQLLYRAFGLRRGSLRELFGWQSFKRAAKTCAVNHHRTGWLQGDGFQLGGVLLVENGHIARAYRCQSASDRPDVIRLLNEWRAPSRPHPVQVTGSM